MLTQKRGVYKYIYIYIHLCIYIYIFIYVYITNIKTQFTWDNAACYPSSNMFKTISMCSSRSCCNMSWATWMRIQKEKTSGWGMLPGQEVTPGAIPVVIRFHLCSSMFINDYLTFLNRDAKWRYIICMGLMHEHHWQTIKKPQGFWPAANWGGTQQPPKKASRFEFKSSRPTKAVKCIIPWRWY